MIIKFFINIHILFSVIKLYKINLTFYILKLLTNKVDCLIGKYDNIMLNRDGQNPIMISNQTLNTILPQQWTLYDEYTIAAPELSDEEWELLKNKAITYDIFNDFIGN